MKSPVVTIGSISDPEMAEQILAEGRADIIGMTRALIADPYWPEKARLGHADDITPCLRCLDCLTGMHTGQHFQCAVNPWTSREFRMRNYVQPAKEQKNVLVIGGGLVGCETGLFLAELGKAVTIVEMQDQIAPEANWMHKEGMMQAFAKQNITTVTGRKVVSISEDGVTVADKNNETTVIASDSVVYAIGMRPNNQLVEELRDCAPFVRAVGDCVRARKVSPAIYEAYYAAVDLA